MTGLLGLSSSKIFSLSLCMILVVYIGHGIIHPVEVFYFSKSVYGIGLNLPNCGTPEENVVHLYRGTRQVMFRVRYSPLPHVNVLMGDVIFLNFLFFSRISMKKRLHYYRARGCLSFFS